MDDFDLISGQDIVDAYDCESYASQEGVLGNSCMKLSHLSERFEIYAMNPDQIKLLVLRNSDSKIRGRALVLEFGLPKSNIHG